MVNISPASKIFATLLGFGILFTIIVVIFVIAVAAFIIIGNYKLFQKAGYNGWEAIIPFYNLWILVKIAGLKEYWFIGLIATSLANFVGSMELFTIASIVVMFAKAGVSYNLSQKFNKSETWFILSIFFSSITFPLLGYADSDKYDKDKVVCENAFFNK